MSTAPGTIASRGGWMGRPAPAHASPPRDVVAGLRPDHPHAGRATLATALRRWRPPEEQPEE